MNIENDVFHNFVFAQLIKAQKQYMDSLES